MPVAVPYDASSHSLFHPGSARDFFALGVEMDYTQPQHHAALCAEMSRLAYVKDEAALADFLKRARFDLEFTAGFNRPGTQLFIARHRDAGLRVVAFRGTEVDDPRDIFADADFLHTPWQDRSGHAIGQVHTGFADAVRQDDILNRIVDHLAGFLHSSILLTGHSLGAALATLTASWLPEAGLFTYGSPRVGDQTFANTLENRKGVHFRHVNCCDIVTSLPPEVLDYLHCGSERYIDRRGAVHTDAGDTLIWQDRLAARLWYLTHRSLLPRMAWIRSLADHAPINYVTGVMGLRK